MFSIEKNVFCLVCCFFFFTFDSTSQLFGNQGLMISSYSTESLGCFMCRSHRKKSPRSRRAFRSRRSLPPHGEESRWVDLRHAYQPCRTDTAASTSLSKCIRRCVTRRCGAHHSTVWAEPRDAGAVQKGMRDAHSSWLGSGAETCVF